MGYLFEICNITGYSQYQCNKNASISLLRLPAPVYGAGAGVGSLLKGEQNFTAELYFSNNIISQNRANYEFWDN